MRCRWASTSWPTSADDEDPRLMSTSEVGIPEVQLPEPEQPPGQESARQRQKPVTIGSVCKALEQEFPDISISKIRYLEDQKLLTPRRTQGGYRLYTAADVQRLRTILRLQRDEFLPLRVIRQELAAGRTEQEVAAPGRPGRFAGPPSPRATQELCIRWRR